MPSIAIFGSFDGLHPGHEHLLHEAKKHGNVLVILAQDSVIRRLKQREPHVGFSERMARLLSHPAVSRVIPSDDQEGAYLCIAKEHPDIVGFGYDQQALAQNFMAWKERSGFQCSVVTLHAYKPEQYKTSLLQKSL